MYTKLVKIITGNHNSNFLKSRNVLVGWQYLDKNAAVKAVYRTTPLYSLCDKNAMKASTKPLSHLLYRVKFK